MEGFANRLKTLVDSKYAGSARAMARALGVSPNSVSLWLLESTKPNADTIAAICEATGVTSDWLLFGDEPEPGKALSPYRDVEQFILEQGPGLKEDEARWLRSMRFSARRITPQLLNLLLATFRGAR